MNEIETSTPRTDSVWQHFSGYLEPLQDAKYLSENLERELKEVTEQRDRLAENLERTLNATVLNHRRDRWHIDAEYTLQLIQSLKQPRP